MKNRAALLSIFTACLRFAYGANSTAISPTGLLWERHFDGSDQDVASNAIVLPSGDIAMVGLSYAGVRKDKTGPGFKDADGWVILTDSLGQKKWDAVFGGDAYDHLTDITVLPNGRLVCAGYSHSEAGPGKSANHIEGSDFWMVCLDQNGSRLWDKAYSFGWTEWAMGVCPVGDQNIAIAGESDGRGWLLVTDKEGNPVHNRNFGSQVRRISKTALSVDGDLFLCGYTAKEELWVGKVASLSRIHAVGTRF